MTALLGRLRRTCFAPGRAADNQVMQARRARSEPKVSEGPAGDFTSPITGQSGMWRSLASAPVLGAGGRRFESGHPDSDRDRGRVCTCSSVGRASARHAEGQRFKPSHVHRASVAQLVEQWTENPRVGGSSPPRSIGSSHSRKMPSPLRMEERPPRDGFQAVSKQAWQVRALSMTFVIHRK